jgi:hypothetical protein
MMAIMLHTLHGRNGAISQKIMQIGPNQVAEWLQMM